jgi:hypothetical protein
MGVQLHRGEFATLAIATVLAASVWMPVGDQGVGVGQGRPLSWVRSGDSQAGVSALAKRPLLDPMRGQDTGQGAAAASPFGDAAAAPVQRYLLRGVARIDNRDIAVIEDQSVKRMVRLQRGQVIGDWYFAGVVGSEATLKNQAGREERLTLVPATVKPVSQPAARPSAPRPGAGSVPPAPAASSGAMPFGPAK